MLRKHLNTLFIVCLLAVSCSRKTKTLDFIFPLGFRGAVVLEGVAKDGSDAIATNEVYKFHIPSSGLLKIKSELPIHSWHKELAHYEDGMPIPVYEPRLQIPKETIAFRPIGGNGNNEAWFAIGTYKEAAEAQAQLMQARRKD